MNLAQSAVIILRGYPKDRRKAFILDLILFREWGETKANRERGGIVTLVFRDGSALTLNKDMKPAPSEIFQC